MCLLLSSESTYGSGPGKVVLRQHGSAWCLSGPLKRLAYSMQDRPFSAAASVYTDISREAWETMNHQTFSSIDQSILGTLGPGDRRLCMRLHSH